MTYDPQADAAWLYLAERPEPVVSAEVFEGEALPPIIASVDAEGLIVSLELLKASEMLSRSVLDEFR
ncbi:MAG TPA: DUF2283 domain-containing protein [Solirubrobacteraceae bacterium]|jgi:uncharacterized protein YuzE|nr:DUF2283 domain-containing protein [Solirubrobacteraceae bacterium]